LRLMMMAILVVVTAGRMVLLILLSVTILEQSLVNICVCVLVYKTVQRRAPKVRSKQKPVAAPDPSV
jgi:hypothetical protein